MKKKKITQVFERAEFPVNITNGFTFIDNK